MYTEFGYIGAIDGIEYSTTHFIHIYFISQIISLTIRYTA